MNAASQAYNTFCAKDFFSKASLIKLLTPQNFFLGAQNPLSVMNDSGPLTRTIIMRYLPADVQELATLCNKEIPSLSISTFQKLALTGHFLTKLTGNRTFIYATLLTPVVRILAWKITDLFYKTKIEQTTDFLYDSRWGKVASAINVAAGTCFLYNRQLNFFGAFQLFDNMCDLLGYSNIFQKETL